MITVVAKHGCGPIASLLQARAHRQLMIWPGARTCGPLHSHEACLLHRAVLQEPEGIVESEDSV
jgi:hypothetical protein